MKNWKKQVVRIVAVGLLSVTAAMTALASSKTRLDTVSDTYWGDDGTTANWDEVEDAYQYEIYLYCDDSQIDKAKTKKTYYDMEKKMKKEGEYTFKVRALAKSGSKEYSDGYWSEQSEGSYISESFAEMIKNGGSTSQLQYGGPGATEGTTVKEESEVSVVRQAKWIQEEGTGLWWYQNADGTYPKSGWWQDQINGNWYFFNDQGYMQTGWIDWNGVRYYCNASGTMVTGENTIDGVQYRFDASGALQ